LESISSRVCQLETQTGGRDRGSSDELPERVGAGGLSAKLLADREPRTAGRDRGSSNQLPAGNAGNGGGLSEKLLAGLERFERAEQRGSRAADRATRPHADAGSDSADSSTGPRKVAGGSRQSGLKDEYARMTRLLRNPAEEVLKAGGEIEHFADWPFTGAAGPRVAPSFAPQIVAGGQHATVWGDKLLEKHHVKDGVLADVVRRYCLIIDMAITYDMHKQDFNPLNAACLEPIFRDLYGIEHALMGKKPKKGKPEEYVPDWARRELYDVIALTGRGSQVPDADAAAVRYARTQQTYDRLTANRASASHGE